MSEVQEELNRYLTELAEKSLRGELSWVEATPSMYALRIEDSRATIQRATNSGVAQFLFEVRKLTSREPLLSLSSSEKIYLKASLSRLFEAARSSTDRRAAAVLGDLLGKLSK